MNVFRKNIDYEAVRDLKPEWLPRVGPAVASIGAQMFTELLLLRLHIEKGATFFVEKQVSDDLQLTDFASGKFEDLPWPAVTVEFNFEDPELGTMLVGKLSRKDLVDTAANKMHVDMMGYSADAGHEHQLISLCQCADGSGSCLNVHDEHTWPRLLETGEVDSMQPHGIADGKMTPRESAALVELLKLCLKVLAYASIPQFKPQPVTPGQLRRGEAKPGVRGRPKRPTFRIVYLPIVRPAAPPKPTTGQKPGAHREFKGRRGHIRWFHSDFYVNMKGKWIYVPPVIMAGAEHLLAKVRKPT